MANNSGSVRFARRAVMVATLAGVPAALLAQERGAAADAYAITDTDTRPADARDFSGLWSRNAGNYPEVPACPECRDGVDWPGYGFFGSPPPRTAEGERRFQLNKPARGLELGSEQAAARTDLDIGYRRAVLPAFGNDPEMRCEPLGLPRLITFSGGGAAMEMVQTEDRIIQLFEWTWDFRAI